MSALVAGYDPNWVPRDTPPRRPAPASPPADPAPRRTRKRTGRAKVLCPHGRSARERNDNAAGCRCGPKWRPEADAARREYLAGGRNRSGSPMGRPPVICHCGLAVTEHSSRRACSDKAVP